MRKFKMAVVAVLAATLVFGATCFAAPSPSKSTDVQATEADQVWLVSGTAKSVCGTKVYTDYSGTTASYKATVVKADAADPATVALTDYVNAQGLKKLFGAYKVRMYNKGASIWDGFGTFTLTVGVGNAYDGQTANVYQIHKDGSVTVTPVVVSQGKVKITVADMGTFYVAF